jgi:hypothetical protein
MHPDLNHEQVEEDCDATVNMIFTRSWDIDEGQHSTTVCGDVQTIHLFYVYQSFTRRLELLEHSDILLVANVYSLVIEFHAIALKG